MQFNPEELSFNIYIDEFRIGRIVIRGLNLKLTHQDNPLVVLWATIRKRVFDKVGLSVVGYFDPSPDDGPNAIKGKFYLSYPTGVNADEHFEKFKNSFPKEVGYFTSILIKWLEDPRGYEAYVRIKEELKEEPAEVRSAAAKAAIQNYLRIIRVRKKND